jgi:hypothetical protein
VHRINCASNAYLGIFARLSDRSKVKHVAATNMVGKQIKFAAESGNRALWHDYDIGTSSRRVTGDVTGAYNSVNAGTV